MADTVTSEVLFDGEHRYVLHLTNVSDGTGESAVQKLDVSTLLKSNGEVPTSVAILEAKWSIQGFTSVTLAFDATADDTALVMAGNDYVSFDAMGGLADPKSTGSTGDLNLTTTGAAAGASYDITLVVKPK